MKELSKINFIEPKPQKELNGEIGLTANDISIALQIPMKRVNKKLSINHKFFEMCKLLNFKMVPCVTINDNNRLDKSWVFDLNAAKAFVAKYDNETGWRYLQFLLQCENILLKDIPKLKSELEAAKNLIERLSKKRIIRKKSEKYFRITIIDKTTDIFGEPVLLSKKVDIPYNQMDNQQLTQFRINHRAAIMETLSKNQKEDLEKNNIVVLPKIKEQKLIDIKH